MYTPCIKILRRLYNNYLQRYKIDKGVIRFYFLFQVGEGDNVLLSYYYIYFISSG